MFNWIRKAAEAAGSLWSPEWYLRNGFGRMAALLGAGERTESGESITVEKAMRCATAYVCTSVICDTISAMPLPLLRKVGENTEILRDEPLFRALNKSPNGYQTAQQFRRQLTHYALNYDIGGVAEIQRDALGRAFGFLPVPPMQIQKVDLDRNEKLFILRDKDGQERRLRGRNAIHLMNASEDGITGRGAVSLAKEAIGQALAIEAYASTFFGRGGVRAAIFSRKDVSVKTMSEADKIEADYEKKFRRGRSSFHAATFLYGDWSHESIGAGPQEAQMVEARDALVPEIARYYRLTPHLANHLKEAHYNNVEHLWIQFLNITLGPWMVQWEQEFERVALTEAQRAAGWYVKHTTAAFLRGDFQTRMAGYATLLQNGIASINEVRALEDWDPVDGGDAHHIQLNMQTVPGTGEPTASEKAALAKLNKPAPAPAPSQPPAAKSEPVVVNLSLPADRKISRVIRDDDGKIAGIEDLA